MENITKETKKSQRKSVRFLIWWTREPDDCVVRTERAMRVTTEKCKQEGDE